MGLKEKIKETGGSVKDQLNYMKKDSKYIKEILQSKEVIYLKTEAIAVLIRKKGNEIEFCDSFDNITKEGYKMMLNEEITDPVPGLNVNLAHVYYFQNVKYIK